MQADEMGGEALAFRSWIVDLVKSISTDDTAFNNTVLLSPRQAISITGSIGQHTFKPFLKYVDLFFE